MKIPTNLLLFAIVKTTNDKDNICNRQVFNKIYELLSGDLYKFLFYKYGPDNNPEDLVLEAFLKLWSNCEKVSPEKAKSFVFTVANNRMLNELSRKKTVLTYKKGNKHKEETHESPQFVLEENEFRERLQRALAELTDEQRLTLMLNRVEGKRHKEIAEMLGISRKAVEKRIYKALAILEKKIGKI